MTRASLLGQLAPLASFALAGACSVVACSSGSDSHPASIPTAGSSASSGGSGGSGGSGHVPNGGRSSGSSGSDSTSAGEAGSAGQNANAGAAGVEEGTVVELTPGTCAAKPTWSDATPVEGVSTAANEVVLSITPDELDLLFQRDGALFLAHRASATAAFGSAAPVTLPAGYVADAGAALSADGKTLVLVSSAGQAFASLSRASRSADFGAAPDTSAFSALNARAVQTLEHFAAPVLSADGKSFVFSGFTPGAYGMSVVYESLWTGAQWAMPNNVSSLVFDGTGDKRPLPSGLSSDSRTLFYFDEATSHEFAIFRDRPDAPLYDPIDLGELAGAVPNAKCDRVYYSKGGDVLTETE